MRNILKKGIANFIFSIIVVLMTVSFSTLCFAENTNNSSWWVEDVRGIRVSIWEKQNMSKIKNIDIFNKPASECIDYKKLSNYTKPELMLLECELSDELKGNLDGNLPLTDNLSDITIDLPDFLLYMSKDPVEHNTNVARWFAEEKNLKKVFECLSLDQSQLENWNYNKLFLIIEPIIMVNMKNISDYVIGVTCTEVGLLACNGYMYDNVFREEDISEILFYALPYGTCKYDEGFMISTRPYYDFEGKKAASKFAYQRMIDTWGAFELDSAASTKVSTDVKKDELPTETVKNETVESIKEVPTIEIPITIFLIPFGVILILLLIIILMATKKKKKDGCKMTNCRFNKSGKCTSNIVINKKAACNEANNYYYFEDNEDEG